MLEGEAGGVKKRPIEVGYGAKVAWDATMNAAIQRIAHHRMADRAEVHADLMRATRMNSHRRERQRAPKMFGADDSGYCLAAATDAIRRGRRHFLAIGGVAADRRVDPAAGH